MRCSRGESGSTALSTGGSRGEREARAGRELSSSRPFRCLFLRWPTHGYSAPLVTRSSSMMQVRRIACGMRYVVMCGPAHNAPDRIVGPFESRQEAARYAAAQPGPPERYAVVETLTSPDSD
jgi:hypothetical protein